MKKVVDRIIKRRYTVFRKRGIKPMKLPKEIKDYITDYAQFNYNQYQYWKNPDNVKEALTCGEKVSRYEINNWKNGYKESWLALTQLLYRIENDCELFYPEATEENEETENHDGKSNFQ